MYLLLKTKQLIQVSIFSFTLVLSIIATAQLPEVDKSPLDISYAPNVFPIQKFQSKQPPAGPLARVIYSRPQKNGRNLFGGEIKYNELWRLGANESTEIEFFKNVNIGGNSIAKGRYTLFCIPQADTWTLIFSKDNYSWGAFSFNPSSVIARVPVAVIRPSGSQVEYLTMYFDDKNHLNIRWDDVKVVLPIQFIAGK
jgi:hypothetical protein